MTENAAQWTAGEWVGFDLETTGPNPQEALIVTASVVSVDAEGNLTGHREWLVDPGVEIPEQATAVHGVTTEHVRANGADSAEAVQQIIAALDQHMQAGRPVVAFNAPYDFTVLLREAQRHGLDPLAVRGVLDPFVIDKAQDRYRKGKRTLALVCEHYGVALDQAHTSAADSLAAVLLAQRLVGAGRLWSAGTLEMLQEVQQAYRRAQSQSLQDWMRRTNPEAVVDGRWPVLAD